MRYTFAMRRPREKAWAERRPAPLTEAETLAARRLIDAVAELPEADPREMERLLRRHTRAAGKFAKDQLIAVYRDWVASGERPHDPSLLRRLQMKPVRTLSGVATVTVLTKPFPCPGECIFCPTDVRMPKSYLHDEPGAQRAEAHGFDPYETTAGRLRALEHIGHPTDKVELLILGGTWSYYPEAYQAWFIKRCLDALNGVDAPTLAEAQTINATAARRNVGLVIETRPDYVDAAELRRLRTYGVTKVQLGAQSLDDRILELNRRGHSVAQTRRAVDLLRAAGFKLHLHWMPNLLGATPESDRVDFARLWADPSLRPDELKIYPCSLLAEAELTDWHARGEYRPYTDAELIDLIADCLVETPRYVRVNRVIRDIPAGHVVAGSTLSNLREVVERRLATTGRRGQDVRAREVRAGRVDAESLALDEIVYDTRGGEERFLSLVTGDDRLVGFLRLSLPTAEARSWHDLEALDGSAIIREVHVYGPVAPLQARTPGQAGDAQHIGLGARLIAAAEARARAAGYTRLAVISAIGTRDYYIRHGFAPDNLYLTKSLSVS